MRLVQALRTSDEDFENPICLVGPEVAKGHTNYRNDITVTERLPITLIILSTVAVLILRIPW